MEFFSIPALVFIVVMLILGICAALYGSKLIQARADTYARLAAHFRGTVKRGDLMTTPSVRFDYHGAGVLVDIHASGSEDTTYYTQVRIDWPDRTLRCEVYPPTVFSRIGKFLGYEDIEIGSPAFDADYHISGGHPQLIRQLLSPGVQQVIDRIRRYAKNDDVYVLFSGGKLLVKKLGLIDEYDSLLTYVLLSLALYDQALLTRAAGIEFVEEQSARESWRRIRPEHVAAAPICQICGDALTSNVVYCRQCKTPHHADCWKYYGACSTYGCREKEFVGQTETSHRK